MMKNVYFLKSTQISSEKFRLNILYEGDEGGIPSGYFAEGPKKGISLIELFGLDRVDGQQNPYSDGVFDWLDNAASSGGIIQSSSGRIYFPYVEPFGKDLRELLGDEKAAKKYCFDSLYTLTKTMAQQYPDQNKYYLEGSYTTAMSGEISLGFNIPRGSVRVTAGGIPLIEDVDYTVDYMMGKVRIINESILNSGTPISISSESNSFSMMTKTMLGMHLNYEFDPKFNVGATLMNLSQKPLTAKNNFGDEPISNTMWGLDLNYEHEVPFITKLVDWLPGIQTKEASVLTINAEFAHFLPGIANTGDEKGVSYIDDFEGAKSSIDLLGVSYWHLSSTPQDVSSSMPMFPETAPSSGLAYGYNRAKLAWYRIDDIFYGSNSPINITAEDRSKPYARRITEQEVFPNKELAAGQTTNIYELNLAFYPSEKGPYNYDVTPTPFSAGIVADGSLNNPTSRWGGIMRKLDYTDFETQNIETIEFWLMDPFIEEPNHTGGKLYFNLGDISEDILRDGRKSYENGLPTDGLVDNIDTTIWGRVPVLQALVNAFDNDEAARKYQDIGYDGLNSTDEATFFENYLADIAAVHGTGSPAYIAAATDPSNDDFTYFRSTYWDNNDVKSTTDTNIIITLKATRLCRQTIQRDTLLLLLVVQTWKI
jgi:cell surface protein SprA